jgi:hypothetical protein
MQLLPMSLAASRRVSLNCQVLQQATDGASCRAGLACWFDCNLAIAHLIFCDSLITVDI